MSQDENVRYVETEEELETPEFKFTGEAKEALKNYYDAAHELCAVQTGFAKATQELERKVKDKALHLAGIQAFSSFPITTSSTLSLPVLLSEYSSGRFPLSSHSSESLSVVPDEELSSSKGIEAALFGNSFPSPFVLTGSWISLIC